MTRINVVDVETLHNKHLLAEYRELPRLFGAIRKYQQQGKLPVDIDIPSDYKLGTGHVKFFINKGKYLIKRQKLLVRELQKRKFNIQHTDVDSLAEGINECWMNDYNPTNTAIRINLNRINERLENMK